MTSVGLDCTHSTDRLSAAVLARRFARAQGLSTAAASSVGVVAAELVSNAVRHAGGGALLLRWLQRPRPGVEVLVSDRGPGLPSPALAVRDGWSRGEMLGPDSPRREGLGTGLGTVVRLMDEVHFEEREGGGTLVRARRWADSGRTGA